MTRPEFNKLLVLLQTYWSKCKRFREEKSIYALFMSLEPFSYEQVRDQIVYLSRVKRFPPDVAEIVEPFAEEIEKSHAETAARKRDRSWMAAYTAKKEREETSNGAD